MQPGMTKTQKEKQSKLLHFYVILFVKKNCLINEIKVNGFLPIVVKSFMFIFEHITHTKLSQIIKN